MNNLDLAFPLYLLRRHAAGARQGRHGSAGRGRWARPGHAVGRRAVHLVHSACFWPGSTRYFS